jgi:hypothetical protein
VEQKRIELAIPPWVQHADGGEAFARRLAAALMDGMEQSVGAVESEGERVVWQAEGWQDDGTFIVLGVDPAERRVQLLLTTRGLQPVAREPSRVWLLVGLVLAASAVIGKWRHSFGYGLVAAVLGFGIWIAIDIAQQVAAERRRHIDPAAWRARLEAGLEAAARD